LSYIGGTWFGSLSSHGVGWASQGSQCNEPRTNFALQAFTDCHVTVSWGRWEAAHIMMVCLHALGRLCQVVSHLFLLMLHMHTVCAGSSMKVHGVPVRSSRCLEGLHRSTHSTISVQCAGCAVAHPLCLGLSRHGLLRTPKSVCCERQSCTRDLRCLIHRLGCLLCVSFAQLVGTRDRNPGFRQRQPPPTWDEACQFPVVAIPDRAVRCDKSCTFALADCASPRGVWNIPLMLSPLAGVYTRLRLRKQTWSALLC
jgi:hypothetical protein